ncbi:uncharacterized protein SETTUDRAFT_31659 [Exserohilum turcica Et28A]|uniref:Uncharacterized protein n=1 Tax=Exserohilum turcicum (strain 28A) TaxID=671987 RepID=R0KH42_EXST2|nr:uncharacterized protein SETTUDRAFT_31659 [Exserohilum turcica Et28A]EOA87392.1 hypothetical protein SETTUDRAFT_31659 [Exserohilum turcica Et28A]
MPTPRRNEASNRVGYVVVEKDGVEHKRWLDPEEPMANVKRVVGSSWPTTQPSRPRDDDDDYHYDSDDDEYKTTPVASLPLPSSTTLSTMSINSSPRPAAIPAQTPVAEMQPPEPQGDTRPISQTTEHLLIAAGSIGATIIIVMLVLAIYTMRKRGVSIKGLLHPGKGPYQNGPPPSLASRYGQDHKYMYGDERGYGMNDSINAPRPAAYSVKSGSFSTQKPLQSLGRSDSFNQPPTRDGNRSFYEDASEPDWHRRNNSTTPSSPVLPIEGQRHSASSRNTRSILDDDEALQFAEVQGRPPSNLPAPPTFRQFLSNRPSISQRPGFGGIGAMASRFSWTNSNAPQTPHDPSRDTVAQSVGRDSYITTRSSVPRFRTVDSWVNQQSNRVEEQRLKQQFRMTQSTACSDDDVPEMPALPAGVSKNNSAIALQPTGLARNGSKSGLVGRDIKHQRHDTQTTAPIFKAHRYRGSLQRAQ